LLLQAGANVDDQDNIGSTAFCETKVGGHRSVEEYLLQQGADPKVFGKFMIMNIPDSEGQLRRYLVLPKDLRGRDVD
jgi:hypothetical protein